MYKDLEISILHHAKQLIGEEFRIDAKRFFHYTNEASSTAIMDNQTFLSSFIRSSSDSLEFAAPMAACRDCVCLTDNLFVHERFPISLFKHFNEEACTPSAKAYFISLSGNSNSAHLRSMYGDCVLEFDVNIDPTDFSSYGFFIKCKYVDDTRAEVFRLLRKWKNEVLERAFMEHKIRDPNAVMKDWFYTLMQFCNTISVGIKQKAFELEDEIRVVIFPLTPDICTSWHQPRALKPFNGNNGNSLIMREYLPLNLKAMGLGFLRLAGT